MRNARTFTMVMLCMGITAIGLAPFGNVMASNDQTSIEDVKKETSELLETLKAYSADKRDQALAESKAALDSLDQRIDALESQVDDNWDEMTAAVRDQARASLQALHKERTQVAEWYGGMKASSAGAWEEMKSGFSNAYSDLAEAWEKAAGEFGAEQDQAENDANNS